MKSSPKIFLVDDNLFSLKTSKIGLEYLGYNDVSLYLNGIICLNNLHLKPNIIFLGDNLNEGAEFEILKKIKLHNTDTYVIFISKEENTQIAVDAIKHGAFEYFVKGNDNIIKMKNVIERIHSSKQ